MKKLFCILIVWVVFSYPTNCVIAQPAPYYNSADIFLQLKKLNVLASVLYIAAHPDDENTRLLAFLAKEKMYRTGYLSLTRGDGGQNLIGNEQGIELGLIRTQELLAARRIDGAEQFFSRAYDFGYSKSAAEAMQIWEKEKILSDVVWVIRKFKPDVIITRFPGDERAGHGHHAASSLLANEAFAAAADSARFTEHFKYGVQPWKAKRILWNTFNFGSTNTTSEDQFKIDVGAYNPLLGKGYGEIASESRSQHKSQGFGVPRQRGVSVEYFTTTGGQAPSKDLFEDVITNWSRVDGGLQIQQSVDSIISGYSFEHPEYSVASLIALHRKINRLNDSYWKTKKLKEAEQLIIACSGLYAEATVSQAQYVAGDSLKVNVLLNKRNNSNIVLKGISLFSGARENNNLLNTISNNRSLNTNENVNIPIPVRIDSAEPLSQPYWLQYPMNKGSFNVHSQNLIGNAESAPAFYVSIAVESDGESFITQVPVQYKFTDPVKGELFQPVVIIPHLSVQVEPSLAVATKQAMPKVNVRYTANAALDGVTIKDAKHRLIQNSNPISRGAQSNIDFPLTVVKTEHHGELIHDTLTLSNDAVAKHPVSIHYDHIPYITYYKPAVISLLNLNIKTVGKNIGYIPGAGDKVPQALEQMGYHVTQLGEQDLNTENLKKFDAVITGIRAYNVNAYLPSKYNDLMEYVKQGGNLIVQYNTNNQLGSAPQKLGPYPFTISRNRITNESAEVHFDLPDHAIFNYPNKITSVDFEGWIQERSIYQAEQVDSNYISPISMADPGEKLSNGSLIISKYGKGNFVYTGLVFFRQLPAGVGGAYRLMANLIALPKHN